MSGYDLSHIRGIVWDLDGTLYRYNDIFIHACNLAAARTVIDLGLEMDFDTAVAMAADSYRMHGSSFKLFSELGIKYEDFHHPYHACVDTTILSLNNDMKAGLEALNVPMVILTNASRDWARKTLDHLDYGHIFGDGMLLALEDVGYQAKSNSTAGFEKACSILGVHPEKTLMVEDLDRNLVHAKVLGMTTALVHHGQIPQSAYAHTDAFFEDTLDLVRLLLTQVK